MRTSPFEPRPATRIDAARRETLSGAASSSPQVKQDRRASSTKPSPQKGSARTHGAFIASDGLSRSTFYPVHCCRGGRVGPPRLPTCDRGDRDAGRACGMDLPPVGSISNASVQHQFARRRHLAPTPSGFRPRRGFSAGWAELDARRERHAALGAGLFGRPKALSALPAEPAVGRIVAPAIRAHQHALSSGGDAAMTRRLWPRLAKRALGQAGSIPRRTMAATAMTATAMTA